MLAGTLAGAVGLSLPWLPAASPSIAQQISTWPKLVKLGSSVQCFVGVWEAACEWDDGRYTFYPEACLDIYLGFVESGRDIRRSPDGFLVADGWEHVPGVVMHKLT